MTTTTVETVETWSWRERPIIAAALRGLDSGEHLPLGPGLSYIETETGLSKTDVRVGVRALERSGWIEMKWIFEFQGDGMVIDVSEEGRRELGSWPSADAMLAQIIDALRVAAESEDRPQEVRSRARQTLDFFLGAGRDVVIPVLASQVNRGVGAL